MEINRVCSAAHGARGIRGLEDEPRDDGAAGGGEQQRRGDRNGGAGASGGGHGHCGPAHAAAVAARKCGRGANALISTRVKSTSNGTDRAAPCADRR